MRTMSLAAFSRLCSKDPAKKSKKKDQWIFKTAKGKQIQTCLEIKTLHQAIVG